MPQGPSRFLSSDLPLDPRLLVWESKDYGGTESWKSVTPGYPWVLMPCHFVLKSSLSCHTEPPDFDSEKLVLEVQSIHNILLGDRARSWVSSCPRAYLDSKRGGDLLKAGGGIAGPGTKRSVCGPEISPAMLQSFLWDWMPVSQAWAFPAAPSTGPTVPPSGSSDQSLSRPSWVNVRQLVARGMTNRSTWMERSNTKLC